MKISFVIVEYYSIEDIYSCVASIISVLPNEVVYEIIVSSNSMYLQNKKMELLAKNKNIIKWIFNENNGGFAYAMNQGLKKATGDILIIMNPDVRVKKGLFDMLLYFQTHLEIGIIAPKIINANGVLQDSFRNFITLWNFVSRHIRRLLTCSEVVKIDNPQDVDWVIGAFMVTNRSAYEKVGGLDNKYFMYCEDMDWCKRMHLQGYSVVYYPQAVIEYEGTRSARHSWKYVWIFVKSLLYYWRKFGF